MVMEKINKGLSQRVNLAGVRFALQLLTTKRRHAIPHIAVKDISTINWKELKASGYKGCVFDKDNTLTSPYAMSFHPLVKDSIRDCMETFDGKVVLLSNSAGLVQYDPKGEEANAIEKTLGIPVLRHKKKKPAGEPTLLESHFKARTEELVMIGDRTFTDIAYGNLMGMLTVKCEPFTSKGENLFVKMARLLEAALVRLFKTVGCLPPAQKLIQTDAQKLEFVKGEGS